ncbi:MAG: ACT domain-containing protein [Butyricicoccus sp.]|nr:ACT domain-containing protein [Butyricicoccus sp.]
MTKPNAKLYIVEAKVLPEIFIEVSRAKELLETGEASTVAEAVSRVGISRSAFYKYKDAIRPFRSMKRDQVITLSVIMRDKLGTLSSVLAIFAGINANILTINQSIPTDGVAIVTISFVPEDPSVTLDMLKAKLEALPEVIRLELLAG